MRKLFETIYAVEITSADTVGFLGRTSEMGIKTINTKVVDDLNIQFQINKKFMPALTDLVSRLGCKMKVISLSGPFRLLIFAKERAALLCGLAFIFILTLFIPSRILFVEVEGNTSLEKQLILDHAESVGIHFGSKRKTVRSEEIKNALLMSLPELKWAGINTYGCRAVISVTERENMDKEQKQEVGVRGIYAARDGIVSEITTTRGTSMCKVGQGVRTGQLLVSGYTDCGLHVRAEQACGEIKAITKHSIYASVPVCNAVSDEIKGVEKKLSIQIGKKRIKLYNSSGNSTPSCDKIYETIHLTLPGGFQLPVSLVKETVISYVGSDSEVIPDEKVAADLARAFVNDSMVGGKILHIKTFSVEENGVIMISGVATCEEIISKLQYEEIYKVDS